jgi:glycogen operon protein
VWTEWNGKYRDCVRDFWRGQDQLLGEFASRFTGSSDLYENTSRLPYASINFVTAHDGFTLNDLVSYNEKHNEANGEKNRDGESYNRSWNCGVEGPADDPEVRDLRESQKRNFVATLLLSQGVPMLLGGDEIGRSQEGNNNAYCQDNEISWYNWKSVDADLLAFCQRLVRYRKDHPVFRRRRWFQGRPIHGSEVKDIAWFSKEGEQMVEADWGQGNVKSLGVFLNGETIPNPNPHGEPVTDDNFYLIFNAHHQPLTFSLPGPDWGDRWVKDLDTGIGWVEKEELLKAGSRIKVEAHSLLVLRHAS